MHIFKLFMQDKLNIHYRILTFMTQIMLLYISYCCISKKINAVTSFEGITLLNNLTIIQSATNGSLGIKIEIF